MFPVNIHNFCNVGAILKLKDKQQTSNDREVAKNGDQYHFVPYQNCLFKFYSLYRLEKTK